MATHVIFYSLSSQNEAEQDNTAQMQLCYHACNQAAHHYRNQQRVFVLVSNQEQAHNVDEMLWSFEPDSFVPHNLVGEGPQRGADVEISWLAPTSRRPILINLTPDVPEFAHQFTTIIDFVPVDENQKILARQRWQLCKQKGFSVENKPAP